MKRDWDLLREQLLKVEEERNLLSDLDKSISTNEVDRLQEESRQLEHLRLLTDEGFIEGVDIRRNINGHYIITITNPRLTMAGHDFLDTLRSATLWENIKLLAKRKSTELTIAVVKLLAEKALHSVFD